MEIKMLDLEDAAVIETDPFIDHRGIFARFFCESELFEIIGDRHIVNVNFSKTLKKGTIRGLHFQYLQTAEMKLVRCIHGAVFDVIVDIRKDSPTFLMWHSEVLSAENMKMLCVPEGFAHGYQVLEEFSEMLYLHSAFYSNEHEGTLNYADPTLAINWPIKFGNISERDRDSKMIDSKFRGI